MSKYYITILLVILFTILAGCSSSISVPIATYTSPGQINTTAPTNKPLFAVEASQTPSPTPAPSATAIPPSASPTVTSPSPVSTDPQLKTNCLEVLKEQPVNLKYYGKLALQQQGAEPNSIIDLETGKGYFLPEDWAWFYEFSPDGKWILHYQAVDQTASNPIERLTLMQADGKIINTFSSEQDWAGYGWFDNQNLAILRQYDPLSYLYSITLFNPFTHQWGKELAPNYPDIYRSEISYVSTVYDPTLAFVVYPQMKNDGNAFVLWDLRKRQPLVTLPTYDIKHDEPKWSPDGEQFVVPIQKDAKFGQTSDFYRVQRDGKVTQLTHFANYVPHGEIHQFSWSPDSRYIAFWMTLEPSKDPIERLAVLDVETQEIINYCIPGVMFDPNQNATPPIWSPEGLLQLIISNVDVNRMAHTILVDLENNVAFQLAEDQVPVVWEKVMPREWTK